MPEKQIGSDGFGWDYQKVSDSSAMPGGAEEVWIRLVDSKDDQDEFWRITRESRDGKSFSHYLRKWSSGASKEQSRLIRSYGDYESLAEAQEKARFTEISEAGARGSAII